MGITLLWIPSPAPPFVHALLQWIFIEHLQYARGSAVPGPPRPGSAICNKCLSWRILGTPTPAGKVGCSSGGTCGAWVPPGGRTGKRWLRRWVTWSLTDRRTVSVCTSSTAALLICACLLHCQECMFVIVFPIN